MTGCLETPDPMKNIYFGLVAISRRLWRPWSADREERRTSEAIALAVFALWLASVPVAVWMAIGDPPGLLAGAAATLLWILGLLYFYCIELPLLMLRLALVWVAGAQRWTGVDVPPETAEQRDAGQDRRRTLFEQLKAAGVLPPDHELPPRSDEELPAYIARTATYRPSMHPAAKVAGVTLIAALVVGQQPLLATFLAVPSLGWFAVEWLGRRLPPGQTT